MPIPLIHSVFFLFFSTFHLNVQVYKEESNKDNADSL